MAKPDLHKFEKDLLHTPALGSTDSPRTIKAKNLDENNTKLTLIKSPEVYSLYDVRYTPEGTVITRIFEDGKRRGDLLFWNNASFSNDHWEVLPAPLGPELRVLTIQEGILKWVETEDCDD